MTSIERKDNKRRLYEIKLSRGLVQEDAISYLLDIYDAVKSVIASPASSASSMLDALRKVIRHDVT